MSCSDHLNLALEDEEGATVQQLQGHSIMYRIATGPQAGRKCSLCKQFQPEKRMTTAPISLEESRVLVAWGRPSVRDGGKQARA